MAATTTRTQTWSGSQMQLWDSPFNGRQLPICCRWRPSFSHVQPRFARNLGCSTNNSSEAALWHKAILFLRLVRHRPYPSTCLWSVALGILCLVLSRPVSFHCLIPINVPTPFHHDINACERHPVASPWYHTRTCLLHSDRNIERLPVYTDQVMSK